MVEKSTKRKRKPYRRCLYDIMRENKDLGRYINPLGKLSKYALPF